jgi:hypothetical protein
MGSIPRDIGKLKNLMELNLSTNQLAGPIPSEIGDMTKITKMYKQEPKINLCSSQNYFSFITHLFSYALETFTEIGWMALSLPRLASWETS